MTGARGTGRKAQLLGLTQEGFQKGRSGSGKGGVPREREPVIHLHGGLYTHTHAHSWFLARNWLVPWWGLAGLKFSDGPVGWKHRLELMPQSSGRIPSLRHLSSALTA